MLSPTQRSATMLAFGLWLVQPPGLWAQTLVDATRPADIVEIARGFGSAHLERDSFDDPMILGRIDGIAYSVLFYGCEDSAHCRSIQLRASWSPNAGITTADMDQWNREKLFGRAYLDQDGAPMLDMVVNLDGGVTLRNLDDTFDWWKVIVLEFADLLQSLSMPDPSQL